MKRAEYLRDLRKLIPVYGSDNVIYFDESGFEADVCRVSGWAEKGKKIYANVRGKRTKRTNLIMAQRRGSGQWLAPILFDGACHSITVLWWIKEYLLKVLKKPSLIIMDNAPFHPKAQIAELLEHHGHQLLCLPKYSPDFNPIENSFAAMKTNWINKLPNTTLDAIVTSKC